MNATWITKASIWFYIGFFIISLLGNLIFKFNDLAFQTIFLYFIYALFFVFGICLGRSIKPFKLLHLNIDSKKLIKYLLPLAAIAILFGWYYMIKYYGNLAYIIGNSYAIRSETIGDGIQIIPTHISYMSSFANAGLVITIARYYHFKEKRDLYCAIAFAFLIVLVDLQSFGRVGILFIIFVLVGCIRLFRIKIKLRKLIIYGSILLVVLMLPRWIRGGNSLEGVADNYTPYLRYHLPSFIDPFVSLYSYYFSGIYALNELINNQINDMELWWGARNFSSLINLFHRFFESSSDFHRITIIAKPVNVPYSINIYTILGEAYMDFGVLGLFLLPLFFGACIGFFFKFKGVYADALKLVFVGWLFFNPIYNLFSFGGFMLAYMFLAFLTLSTKQEINATIIKLK